MNLTLVSRFIFGVLFWIGFVLQAQDKVPQAAKPIEVSLKPLQLDGGFTVQHSVEILAFDENKPLITEFSKDYIFNNLTYDPVRDPRRLAYNSGLFVGGAVLSFGILWVLPESVSNWDKEEIKETGLINKWKNNVSEGPIWDNDSFFFNWITHPWAGAVYYMAARGSGFSTWESFGYSLVFSTFFWEYGVEAFAEVPSWQDIIITPTIGSVFGEGFFYAKRKIIENDHKILKSRLLGVTALVFMDPFNEILDGLGYKTKNKIQTYSSFAPIQYDYIANKPVWGISMSVNF
jgi:Domain of unknown function (DUF3943)